MQARHYPVYHLLLKAAEVKSLSKLDVKVSHGEQEDGDIPSVNHFNICIYYFWSRLINEIARAQMGGFLFT